MVKPGTLIESGRELTHALAGTLQRPGALTPQQLERSVKQAKAQNVSVLDFVRDRGVSDDVLANVFSQWLNVPRVHLDSVEIDPAVINVVPERVVRRHTCLPVSILGKKLVVAIANPLDDSALRDVQVTSNLPVQLVVAARAELVRAIERFYSARAAGDAKSTALAVETVFAQATPELGELNLDNPAARADNSPAVDVCNMIVRDALTMKASDIHIEPRAEALRVRLRIDGMLREHLEFPRWMHEALVSRIKVLARLDIAERRLPQDGRIKVTYNARRSDIRVSTLPTHFGEKAVLRLLGASSIPALGALGLSHDEASLVAQRVGQPQGLILVTGPTGAGKTTTLYSMIAHRQSPAVNIVTIEDPIEYHVGGISQVQIDAKAGLDFPRSLRAILRQDPDVILVGEIRDVETAEVALQAALTGHLVFSTLHTNSSMAAIERLLDLGVSPLLIAAATSLVIAQRLLRRVCPHCRAAYVPSADTLRLLRLEPVGEFVRGSGCAACGQTGYSGRIGVFEILRLTPELKELIRLGSSEAQIAMAARSAVTSFLLEAALDKVRNGLTTVEEVTRVLQIDHDNDLQSSHLLDRLAGVDFDPVAH